VHIFRCLAAAPYDDQSCKYQMDTKCMGLLRNETAVDIDSVVHWAYGAIVARRRG
jgi:hypothetical protein